MVEYLELVPMLHAMRVYLNRNPGKERVSINNIYEVLYSGTDKQVVLLEQIKSKAREMKREGLVNGKTMLSFTDRGEYIAKEAEQFMQAVSDAKNIPVGQFSTRANLVE